MFLRLLNRMPHRVGERQMILLHQCRETSYDPYESKQQTNANDEHLPGDLMDSQFVPFEFHVKVAWPNEGEHRASKVANQSHEQGKVGNGYCRISRISFSILSDCSNSFQLTGHEHGGQHEQHSNGYSPNTQIIVSSPARWKWLVPLTIGPLFRWLATEEGRL